MNSTKSIGRSFLVIAPWLMVAFAVFYSVFEDYQRRATREKISQERAIQELAVNEIWKLGGSIRYERQREFRVISVEFIRTGKVINGKAVINEPKITDEGLVHLKALTGLQTLNLSHTKVTDNGLVHLKGLTNLRSLNLTNAKVTDEGVEILQKELPNCKIER